MLLCAGFCLELLGSWPQLRPWLESLHPFTQWWTVLQTPRTFHILPSSSDPILSILPPREEKTKSPVPVERLVLCGPQHCPVFLSLLWRVTPGLPRTCAAPRSLQECAGACNRLCGGHWVVHGWLKLPNLTARWPLNGAQRGAALQTTAAAKFLQWSSTITPTQAPVYTARQEGWGRRGGMGWWCVCVCVRVCWTQRFKVYIWPHFVRFIHSGPNMHLAFFSPQSLRDYLWF